MIVAARFLRPPTTTFPLEVLTVGVTHTPTNDAARCLHAGRGGLACRIGLLWVRDYQERQWLAVTANASRPRPARTRSAPSRSATSSAVTSHTTAHVITPGLSCETPPRTPSSRAWAIAVSPRAPSYDSPRGEVYAAQRVNLHGRYNHVVAEVELGENRFVLFDPQLNPGLNRYFDSADITVDQLITQPNTPFNDYSNLNLRRVPIIGSLVLCVRIQEGPLTRTLESPWLTKAALGLTLSGVLVIAAVVDRMFVRLYARRFGLLIPKTR